MRKANSTAVIRMDQLETEILTAQVIIRYMGLEQSERDILERMGTRMLAHAVLLANSVTKVLTKAMMKLTTSGSRTSRPELMVRSARNLESPDFLVMSARAKPPPSSRITPQGRRFSTDKKFLLLNSEIKLLSNLFASL